VQLLVELILDHVVFFSLGVQLSQLLSIEIIFIEELTVLLLLITLSPDRGIA